MTNLIRKWQSFSPKSPLRAGDKPRHYLKRDLAIQAAIALGYREEEFEEAVQLLETRGLITLNAGRTELIEEFARVLSVQEIQANSDAYAERLKLVKVVLPDNPQLAKWLGDLDVVNKLIKFLASQHDESKQNSVASTLKSRQADIDLVIEGERTRIAQDLAKLAQQGLVIRINNRVLEQPLNPGLFSNQLEAQRANLTKACVEVFEAVTPLEQRLAELVGLAGQSPLPDSDLAALIQGHRQLRQNIFQQQNRQAELDRTLGYYEQTRSLLN